MTNQFTIVPYKVLNGTVNTLSVYGSIQLFSEEFNVQYSLNNVQEPTPGVPTPIASIAAGTINGSVTVKRSALSELSETAVVAEVVKQLGIKLAVA
jgi:hypothetical protein